MVAIELVGDFGIGDACFEFIGFQVVVAEDMHVEDLAVEMTLHRCSDTLMRYFSASLISFWCRLCWILVVYSQSVSCGLAIELNANLPTLLSLAAMPIIIKY